MEADRKLRWYQLSRPYAYRPYPYGEEDNLASSVVIDDRSEEVELPPVEKKFPDLSADHPENHPDLSADHPENQRIQEAAEAPVEEDMTGSTENSEESPQEASESVTEDVSHLTARELVAKIKKADSADEVVALLADDERKTVQQAASARLAALEKE
jgi:hypothetical protein